MVVEYEAACRQDDLGALLTAAFLAREGARILLLPPLAGSRPEPNFILPVVRGYPARLLADFIDLKLPATAFFAWQAGADVQSWPGPVSSAGALLESEITTSKLNPELWQQLDKLWHLIDSCMVKNIDMPANSLVGFWQMFLLLLRSELLRENRNYTLDDWLDSVGITFAEQCQWHSLVPLLSLYRFAKLPLISFAYGVQTLLQPDGLIDVVSLKRILYEYLLAQGAQQVTENWLPVFDGKWYIGVGHDNQAACRSTVYLASSHPDELCQEISVGNQRHDFKRQLRFDDPGYLHVETQIDSDMDPRTESFLYHLQCSDSTSLSGSEFFTPVLESGSVNSGAKRVTGHSWRKLETGKNIGNGAVWGWQPRLPAMMGGGFLPLTGSLCRFYRVGWHNLPGFGLGGLVYSARMSAFNVLKNEL